MSVTILKDTEEALLREFKNILQAQQRTVSYQALPSLFDPLTGEKLEGVPLEAYFYDSSDNARNIEYPHVFIKILRSEEDLTSGRIVPPYGKEVSIPIPYATRAYEIVVSGFDLVISGTYATATDTLDTPNIIFTAVSAGTIGNSISLVFNGTATVATVVGAWNTANPTNQVSYTGLGTVIPMAQTINLSGGIINQVNTNNIKSRLINNTQLLGILGGPNAGTYKIESVAPNADNSFTITISPILVNNLPASYFTQCHGERRITFLSPVDLNTVAAGDIYTDSLSNTFVITSIDLKNNMILLDHSHLQPSLLSGGFISRIGNILPNVDTNLENFLVLDPNEPIIGKGLLEIDSNLHNTYKNKALDWAVPLDLVFGITIDSKVFDDHTAIWNRVWEEFNPPRRGLPIIVRTPQSGESFLAEDFSGSSSNQIVVKNSRAFIVGEEVRIFNQFTIGFETQIIGINNDTNTLMLASPVPCEFNIQNKTKVVSNSVLVIWEWDFLSHRDNSNDGSQYWSHAYEYRVQVWVNKKYGEEIYGVIRQIQGEIEDFNSNVLNSIKVP
jgi:hypothetical protein